MSSCRSAAVVERRSLKGDGGPVPRSHGEGAAVSGRNGEDGFTLVETLIATVVLTVGLLGIAGLLTATTTAQISARESARSVRLASGKMDELMKLPFSSPEVTVGGGLDENVDDYNESPDVATTIRWRVEDGPTDDTRVLTVRVINLRGQQARQAELSTIIRE